MNKNRQLEWKNGKGRGVKVEEMSMKHLLNTLSMVKNSGCNISNNSISGIVWKKVLIEEIKLRQTKIQKRQDNASKILIRYKQQFPGLIKILRVLDM